MLGFDRGIGIRRSADIDQLMRIPVVESGEEADCRPADMSNEP